MKRKLLSAALLVVSALGFHANAQTDVTNLITNPGFEDCEASIDNITTAMEYSLTGWTKYYAVDSYAFSAVVEYGGTGQVNGASAPSGDNTGAGGKALGVSLGWSGRAVIYRSASPIELEPGKYTLSVNAYNANTAATAFKSKLGFVAENGSQAISTKNSFTSETWEIDEVVFYLTEKTQGYIQIGGHTTGNVSSAAQGKVFFDNLTLTKEDLPFNVVSVDETAKVCANSWDGQNNNIITVGSISTRENYNGSDVSTNGDILYQTVSGLAEGLYDVQLYAAASRANNVGNEKAAVDGELERAFVFADANSMRYQNTIPMRNPRSSLSSEDEIGPYTMSNIYVGEDGNLKIGLTKEADGTNWHVIQIKSLTRTGVSNAVEKAAYEAALAAAKAALENTEYENVLGAEKTALEAAIQTYGSVTSGYSDATSALNAATTAFTDAKVNYDLLAAENDKAEALGVERYTIVATTTATDAAQAVKDLKVAEYNKVASSYTTNIVLEKEWTPSGDETTTNYGQHWSGNDANGYLEQLNGNKMGWGANSWDIAFDNDITLPEGQYVFKMTGRHEASCTLELMVTIGEKVYSVSDFPVGDTGLGVNKNGVTSFDPADPVGFVNDSKGRGWEWRYVPFTLDQETNVKLKVHAATSTEHQWVSFSDYSVVAIPGVGASRKAYEASKAVAESALQNDDYKNIIGSERTELANLINDDTFEKTAEGYDAQKEKIDNAVTAFISTKAVYDMYAQTKASAENINEKSLPYASVEKINAANVTVNKAEEAASATNAIRAAYESNALGEGVYGVDKTSLIKNAKGEEAEGWSATGTNNNDESVEGIGIGSGQSYTDADGNAGYKYLDKNTLKNITVTQTIENLPAGKYILSTTARCNINATKYELSVNEESVNIPIDGNSGGVFNNGWNDVTVEFTQIKDGDATIKVFAEAESGLWVSIARFRLVQIAEVVPVSEIGYATFASEQPLDLSTLEDATAYIVTDEAESNYVKLTEQTEAVAGNTGLLIAKENGGTVTIQYASNGEDLSGSNYLKAGTGAEAPKGSYVLSCKKGADGEGYDLETVGFYVVDTDQPIVEKGKAYLDFGNNTIGAKALYFVFGDGTATAIETAETAEADADGAIYNVAGQQVGKDYKGIVIKNGKKYLNK